MGVKNRGGQLSFAIARKYIACLPKETSMSGQGDRTLPVEDELALDKSCTVEDEARLPSGFHKLRIVSLGGEELAAPVIDDACTVRRMKAAIVDELSLRGKHIANLSLCYQETVLQDDKLVCSCGIPGGAPISAIIIAGGKVAAANYSYTLKGITGLLPYHTHPQNCTEKAEYDESGPTIIRRRCF